MIEQMIKCSSAVDAEQFQKAGETGFRQVDRPRIIVLFVLERELRIKLLEAIEKQQLEAVDVNSLDDVLRLAWTLRPEAVVIETYPHDDHSSFLRRLKSERSMRSIPVILLTEKIDDAAVILQLEQGADDTIPRSVSPRVFIARLRAIIRAKREAAEYADQVLIFDQLQIHPRKHLVMIESRTIKLTATEFKILVVLASRPGWVFSRDEIVSAIHNGSSGSGKRSVDVNIVRLRSHLKPYGHLIETVRQVGYRFHDPMISSRKSKQ